MKINIWPLFLRLNQNRNLLCYYSPQEISEFKAHCDSAVIDASDEGELSQDELPDILAGLTRSLSDNAELGIHFYNSLSYQFPRLRGTDKRHPRFSLTKILGILHKAGFVNYRIYSNYPDDNKVVEMAGLENGKVYERGSTLKDNIRIRILQSALFKYFQPAYIVIAAKSRGGFNNFIDCIVRSENYGPVRNLFLGFPDTLIAVFEQVIIRVPTGKQSVALCRQSKRILLNLARTKYASQAPMFIKEATIDEQPYFCESKLAGTALNLPADKIEALANNAIRFITEFHKDSLRDIVINDGNFKRLFLRNFKRFAEHLSNDYSVKLNKISEYIQRQVINRNMKSVWSHGDYKLEKYSI